MYSKTHQAFIPVLLVFCIVCIPQRKAFAETIYSNKTFSQSTLLKRANHPYYFSGQNTIPNGVTVTVEKGTEIFVDGNITVFGKLVLAGESISHIQMKQSDSFDGVGQDPLTIIGGELHASYVDIRNTVGLLDAFSTSTVILDSVTVENIVRVPTSNLMAIFNNSLITIKNSSFKNITSRYGIEVFNKGSLDMRDSTFVTVGTDVSIVGYGSGTTLSVEGVHFDGQDEQGGVSHVTQKALEIFSGAYTEISFSTFQNFAKSAISSFANAQIGILSSIFTKNKIGIESYGSNIHMEENEVFENTQSGAVLYDGTIDATNNWWGSETGPKNITLNPNGNGDEYIGDGSISPWKDKRPKKEKCCSSILFVPGLQGSRMYSKGIFSENQLWEPNITSDITKLGLNSEGYSSNRGLYLRDVIDRTNIVFGGNSDIEIYKGLIKSLNGLNSNYSIEDWQTAVYDWRMSPNTIVMEGTRYNSPTGQYKKMEDQVTSMALISKTKKVTLLAHSYGGLVIKRFLVHMLQKGKIDLIDKVVFVGVPENGSPASLFALLHGDNQDIGNGYIVNASTMRSFAQNMPAVYSLLPKVNQDLVFGIQATNTISVAVPGVSTVESMYRFLFKEVQRPSTFDPLEINVPFIANKKVKQKIDIESTSSFVKPQSEESYSGIQFYNILGVGLNTPKSITYTKKPCVSLYTHPSFMSSNCGLDHVPNFSQIGDGTVLAHDVFSSQNQLWGEKYIFNISEYNRKNNKNYSHANIPSAQPVTHLLMQIFMNTVGDYALPEYITAHGGGRMGGTSPTGNPASSYSESVINSANRNVVSNLLQNKRFQISTSDTVLISGKENIDTVLGFNFPRLTVDLKKSQILPIKNTIPNSDVSHMGSSYYVHTETLPSALSIIPNPNMSDSLVSEFNLHIKEITPIAVSDADPTAANFDIPTVTNILASFEHIPITEYSTITVHVDTSSSTDIKFEMKVIDRYEDVYTNTTTYTVPTLNGEPADILSLIGLVRTEILKSSLRLNFKERYLLKLGTIEKNYRSPSESKRRSARAFSKDTTTSLVSIIKDLNRSKSLYYKGGMKKAEASFLHSQFSKISRAFGDQ